MKRFTKSFMVLTITAALALSFATLAAAQSDALSNLYLSAANVPTNIVGIHTYAEPPKGFSPVAATDVELATYGFPQRPDKQADPDHYALWERAMKAAKIRWNGELKPLHAGGGMIPASSSSLQPTAEAFTPLQRSNISGSGVMLNNGRTTWSNNYSFNDIWTVISVPVVTQPFDNTTGCTASDYVSVSLAGIDGKIEFGANGVPFFLPEENVGVYEDFSCVYGVASYTAYVGWENTLNGVFSLNPGDLFYTEVHAFGGCNNGSAFVEDLRTLTYSSYTIPNPCFVGPQIGRYANWMVWRPCCSGPGPDGAWPLANTIGISFDGAAALNGLGTHFYPGSQASSTQVLSMTDDGSTQAIEIVNQGSSGYQGQHSLFFETTGCAYTGGCTP